MYWSIGISAGNKWWVKDMGEHIESVGLKSQRSEATTQSTNEKLHQCIPAKAKSRC
jgi:hypothetical protein